jgi:hypothetical protein
MFLTETFHSRVPGSQVCTTSTTDFATGTRTLVPATLWSSKTSHFTLLLQTVQHCYSQFFHTTVYIQYTVRYNPGGTEAPPIK